MRLDDDGAIAIPLADPGRISFAIVEPPFEPAALAAAAPARGARADGPSRARRRASARIGQGPRPGAAFVPAPSSSSLGLAARRAADRLDERLVPDFGFCWC